MATSAKDTAKLQVEVEARTDAAVAQFEQLQSSTKKYREETEKANSAEEKGARARERQAQAAARFGEAITGTAKAQSKATLASEALVKALDSTKDGTISAGKAALAAAANFGPWGVAIGAVGTVLVEMVEHSIDAERQIRELSRAAQEEMYEMEKRRAEVAKKLRSGAESNEYDRTRVEPIRNEIRTLDLAIARMSALGEATDGLERSREKLLAQIERAQGKNWSIFTMTPEEGAAQEAAAESRAREIEHRLRVSELAAESAAEQAELDAYSVKVKVGGKKSTGKGSNGGAEDPAFAAGLAESRMAGQIAGMDRQTAAEAAAFESELAAARAAKAAEMTRTIHETEEEIAARREAALVERHERELARLAEEKAAREDAVASYMRGGEMIADTAAGIAAAYLTNGDLSARGFRRAVGQFAAAEAIRLSVVALRETVLGGVAASNPFTAALAAGHFAAAGQAAGGAAALGAIALGLGAAGGGGARGVALSAPSSPAITAANDRPAPTNSQRDVVPISEASMQSHAQAQSRGSTGGGSSMVTIGTIQVLGAIDESSARKIAQGIKLAQDRGGRLTA